MATYYCSPFGSDSNNGLGPDPTAVTNKPYLTLGKLLNASGVIASGDQAYLAPGTYRQTIVCATTSPVAETKISGDPGNAQAFKDASGVLVTPGPVILSAYLTNDKTAPAAAACIDTNTRDFLTFENIYIMGGSSASAHTVMSPLLTSTNITFTNCQFISGAAANNNVSFGNAVDTALHWLFDRCVFVQSSIGVIMQPPTTNTAADYDLDVVFKSCIFLGGSTNGIRYVPSGALTNKPGGVIVLNCLFAFQGTAINCTANTSTTIPNKVYNSHILFCSTGLAGTTSGQIVEDYNVINANTPRTSTATGANSFASFQYAPLLDYAQSRINGFLPQGFFAPLLTSPLLGFGNQSSPTPPAVDIENRPRPSNLSTLYSIGPYERHDPAVKETTTTDAGSVGLAIWGPGDHDLVVPVNAVSTTFTIRARYDDNHAATNKPQVILQANPEAGVTVATTTMTAAVNTWETLTVGPFTPSAKGFVTLRLVSRSSNANATSKAITAITAATAAVVTVGSSHGFVVGDRVAFAAIVGMTQMNGLVGTVTAIAATTITMDINSAGFTAYSSGGTAGIVGKAFFDTAVVPDIDTGDFAHFRKGEPFPAPQNTGAGSGGPIGPGRLTGGLQ